MEENKDDQPFNINSDELSTPSMHQIGKKMDIKKIAVSIILVLSILIIIIIIIIIIASINKGTKSKKKLEK